MLACRNMGSLGKKKPSIEFTDLICYVMYRVVSRPGGLGQVLHVRLETFQSVDKILKCDQ